MRIINIIELMLRSRLFLTACLVFLNVWIAFGQVPNQNIPNQQGQGQPQQQQRTATEGQLSLTQTDLSRVQVDQLSDAQVRRLYTRSQEMGLTENDLYTALQERGMPASEVNKLRARIAQIKRGVDVSAYEQVREEEIGQEEFAELFSTIAVDEEAAEITELQEKIFGFDLFNTTNLTFQPSLNIPTPENYIVGPGDEIVIDIWGASENTYQLPVTTKGNIRIPSLGPVYISGMTIERASRRIEGQLYKIYAGLNPANGRPNTFVDISLGNVRSIKVSVLGEARRPGTYTLNSLSSVFNALYLSGGPTVRGSMRKIEVIRAKEKITELDVYDFLMNGKSEDNIFLADQDIIKINPYISRIEVEGEVKRPGIFEIKAEESFADLINYAGGFTENAYTDRIKVRRNTGKERKIVDIPGRNMAKAHPGTGDFVTVESILNRFSNRVQISGAVFREGEYELEEGMTLLSLVEKADGLRGDAYLGRSSIHRMQDDFTTKIVSINLREVMKDKSKDIVLQREDFVIIPSIYDLKEEPYVEIEGDIRIFGVYPFMENMTIEDLVALAGGLRESASALRVEVARRIKGDRADHSSNEIAEIFQFRINKDLKVEETGQHFYLEPFDKVYVRRAPGYQPQETVILEGQVFYPGTYTLTKKNERISNLIRRAGGLTVEAYPEGATLIRRTETFIPPTELEQRYQDLIALYRQYESAYYGKEKLNPTEAEQLRNQRLAEIARQRRLYVEEELKEAQQARIAQMEQVEQEVGIEGIQVQQTRRRDREAIGIKMAAIVTNPGSSDDLILEDGDIISIPKELQTVRMRGEVLYPVTARFEDNKSFRNYISEAGGFTDQAAKKKAYIVYANGSVDRTKSFLFFKNYPKVERGAQIFVPTQPPKQPLNPQQVAAIGSAFVSLSLSIIVLINQL